MWTRLRALTSRVGFLIARRRFDDDLRAEIDAHLESLVAHYRAQGMTKNAAHTAAHRQFGNTALLRRDIHEMNGIPWVEQAAQDVRYAARQLARQPAFTGIVIATLALGIGSTTAIFSVVEAVLLRPLPYPDADRIVRIIERTGAQANAIGYESALATVWNTDVPLLRAQATSVSHVGVATGLTATVTIDEASPVRLEGARVSPAMFEMLGARAALGRLFLPSEEEPSSNAVVVISHALWQQHFGGRADVLGHRFVVDRAPFTIVGVMEREFQFPDTTTRFWVPFTLGTRVGRVAPVLRLVDGIPVEAAAAKLEPLLQDIRRNEPWMPGAAPIGTVSRFELRTIQDELVAPVRPLLVVLASAVAFVLLIACVNVTNLLLNRNAARRKELALRMALGASPSRIVRYVLTETLLVATGGGVGGVLFAFGAVSLVRALGTSLSRRDLTPGVSIPRLEGIGIDGTALLFALATTICVGVLVGLLPIARYALARHGDALTDGLSSIAIGNPAPSRRQRAALVVAQTALATMSLVGGGLLMHSFVNLANVDPGYDAAHVLTFVVRSTSGPGSVPFAEEVAERLRTLPGVKASGYAELLPMVRYRTGGPLAPASPMPAGTPPPPAPLDMRTVSHGFVDAMGMRVVAGRSLRRDDQRAVLLNETLARTGFLGTHALGQQVMVAGHPDPFDVVGIVQDVRQYGLDQDPDPQVFVDARQLPPGNPRPYFALRVHGDPLTYVSSVRRAVAEIDPPAIVDDVATMQQVVSNALSRPRLFAVLAAAFGMAGAFLAAIGIYGVTAAAVTQRTRELAVRLALGARPHGLLLLVMQEGVGWTIVGLGLGVIGSLFLSHYLEDTLFGLTPVDPATFTAVAATFLVAATLATLIPARRITRVDPVVALRALL
jgi:putative ABC transport system permease protein